MMARFHTGGHAENDDLITVSLARLSRLGQILHMHPVLTGCQNQLPPPLSIN
jgi:hypothetical protein